MYLLPCIFCHATSVKYALTSPFCHAPSDIHRLPCTICHATSVINLLSCTVCHELSAMHHLSCNIRHEFSVPRTLSCKQSLEWKVTESVRWRKLSLKTQVYTVLYPSKGVSRYCYSPLKSAVIPQEQNEPFWGLKLCSQGGILNSLTTNCTYFVTRDNVRVQYSKQCTCIISLCQNAGFLQDLKERFFE